jgi:hypothetical protein
MRGGCRSSEAAASGTAARAVHGISGGGGRDDAASTSTVEARRVRGVLSLLARNRTMVDGARQIARVYHRKLVRPVPQPALDESFYLRLREV